MTPNSDVVLLLGTNLGDRPANIERAKALLSMRLGATIRTQSPVVETRACGFCGPDFLNCAVSFENIVLEPEAVLGICKEIEREMGRFDAPEYDADGNRIYHDRIIDIDILLYGGKTVDTPSLTIPHPQVATRPFVAELLKYI